MADGDLENCLLFRGSMTFWHEMAFSKGCCHASDVEMQRFFLLHTPNVLETTGIGSDMEDYYYDVGLTAVALAFLQPL
jgi:hypothetical protein